MIFFFLSAVYLFILGILLTFDLVEPGDILRGVNYPVIYKSNQANSSNDYKQYKLNIKNLTEPIFIPWSHGGI